MQTNHIHFHTHFRSLALSAALCAIALPACAQGWRPDGYFVQGGLGGRGILSGSVGLTWPWAWKAGLLGTEVSGVTEASISHWNATAASDGRRGFTQVALVPMFRFRPDQGRSPWFAEAGIGISAMDHHFVTTDKQFSTSFNFVDVLGVGRGFGASRAQEIGLRLQHVSNGSIKSPNPGQNFLQLRYATSF